MSSFSNLLGAWAPAGAGVKARLGEDCIRAMRAALAPGSAALEEAEAPGVWLLAGKGKLAGCTAYEGFMPGGEAEGHYVLARASATEVSLVRALSGGERLYYLRLDDMLVFSSTLRALLAHPRVARAVNCEKAREAMLAGVTLHGDATLLEGVAEVPAGHALRFDGKRLVSQWHFSDALKPLEGDPATLARGYREALTRAIVACAGSARPVAVALSGGIDSAAVAALAVEAFGAGQVVAYTHEFDDPAHPSETPYAVEVCRQLGVRHEIFRVTLEDFIAAIPETVWRAESFAHWPKAFLLATSRHIRDCGHDRYLCGFGIGSHMAYYEDLCAVLRWLPAPMLAAYWKLAHARGLRWLDRLEHVHPGLARPSLRMLPLLSSLLHEGRVLEAMRYQSFGRLLSCVDVTRWEKPLRELGVLRLSPAHFASTLPYAYLPYHPRPFVWSAERRLRPGKYLLRLAMAGRIPDSVIYRRKSWADAVISRGWLAAGRRWMRQACGDPPRALRKWDARSPQHAVTGFAFWQRLFLERAPSAQPPTWEEILTPP